MTDYSNKLYTSDLDAYRSDGNVDTSLSITFSGTIAASGSATYTSGYFSMTNLDFNEILYDNSIKHSGRYRNFLLEPETMVKDNTSGTEFTAYMYAQIISGQMRFVASILNTTASTLTLQTTVVNFRIVGYDSTLL